MVLRKFKAQVIKNALTKFASIYTPTFFFPQNMPNLTKIDRLIFSHIVLQCDRKITPDLKKNFNSGQWSENGTM